MTLSKKIGVGSGAAALALLSVSFWLLRQGDLVARIQRDIGGAYRPTPSAPSARGDLGELLFLQLKRGVEEEKALPDDVRASCARVLNGEEGFFSAPFQCRALFREYAPAAVAVTHAARDGRGDFLRGTSPLDADFWKPESKGSVPLQFAARVATGELWRRLSSQDVRDSSAEEAGQDCLDILALGRQLMASGGFVGIAVGSSVLRTPLAACARATEHAPLAEQQQAERKLLLLRESLPSFDDALQNESAFAELAFARVLLSEAQLATLPTKAAQLARSHPSVLTPWQARLAPLQLRALLAERDALLATADEAPSRRSEALKRVSQRAIASHNPLRRMAALDAAGHYRRHRHAVALIEALAAGAHAAAYRGAHGHWPTLEEVAPALLLRSADLLEFDVQNDDLRVQVLGTGEPLFFTLSAD
jgi:hypothetical protein